MLTTDTFCDICAALDVTKLATKWCPQCEEAYCSDCLKQHNISKVSRTHSTINFMDYKRLPAFVAEIRQTCEEHNKMFHVFCTYHDTPCCGVCIITNHCNCQGLFPIDDVIDNAKMSSTLLNVEELLCDIRRNIETLVKDRTQNLENFQSQAKNIKDVVRETREQLSKHLDKLESDLIMELTNKECQIKLETENVVKDLTDKDLKIKECQDGLNVVKKHGTDMQTFYGIREVLKYVQLQEKHVNAFFEKGSLQRCDITFKLDDIVNRCVNAERLGNLLVTNMEAVVTQFKTMDTAAQIGKTVQQTNSIYSMRAFKNKEFHVESGESNVLITGCDVTQDGQIVLSDCSSNKRVIIHSIDGKFINKINTSPHHAFDVSIIDTRRVVVSSGGNEFIQIIDMSTNSSQVINTSHFSYGVAQSNGKVFAALYDVGIISYCIEDELESQLPKTIRTGTLEHDSYITCFQDKLYYTNKKDHSVTCLNEHGEFIWTFIDKTLITEPRSIATDRNGNVFVSSSRDNSVVVIAANGKYGRRILAGKDDIDDAWAMSYDKLRDILVVVNRSGKVLLFDIV